MWPLRVVLDTPRLDDTSRILSLNAKCASGYGRNKYCSNTGPPKQETPSRIGDSLKCAEFMRHAY